MILNSTWIIRVLQNDQLIFVESIYAHYFYYYNWINNL